MHTCVVHVRAIINEPLRSWAFEMFSAIFSFWPCTFNEKYRFDTLWKGSPPPRRRPEFRFEHKRWNDNEVERKWQRQGWVNGTRRDTRLLTTTTTTVRPVIEITNRSAWPRSHDDVRIYVSTNHVYDANRIEDSRNIKASVRLRRGVLRSPFYTRISRTCFTSTYREENGHRIMSTNALYKATIKRSGVSEIELHGP